MATMPAGNLIGGNLTTPNQASGLVASEIAPNLIPAGPYLSDAKARLLAIPELKRSTGVAVRAVMASPPTVTVNGASPDATNTRFWNSSLNPGLLQVYGGSPLNSSSGVRRYYSVTINPTGGNIGSSTIPGASGDVWRAPLLVDALKPSFRLGVSTQGYRFIVTDPATGVSEYVSLTPTTVSASGSYEYVTLDFTAVGGRALRLITVEGIQNCGFDGVVVSTTEAAYVPPAPNLTGVVLGDSYAFGSSAAYLADGVFMRMADYLGIDSFMVSGSGGTGWTTAASTYRFQDRIALGDLGRNGVPDFIFLMGSYNDRNATTEAAISEPALAGMLSARQQFPNAWIVVVGAFPGNSGPSTGILRAEAGMATAFARFNDSRSVYVPISNDPAGRMLFGTGTAAAPNSTGNSDLYVESTGVHLNDAGCAAMGKALAQRVLSKLNSVVSQ